jgi:lipoyl(octanoyl) transferase
VTLSNFIRDQFDSEAVIHSIPVEVRRHRPDYRWTYGELNVRQQEIANRVCEGGKGALLLSEVAPVITLGRRALETEILVSPEHLSQMGIEVTKTDRGGLATYHGPGQWVMFPVDRLERLCGDSRGVRRTVEGLLEVALRVGRKYDPQAEIRSGKETGVWTPRGKFASVGVHIEKGVLLHGLAINGYATPTSFQGLRPCGLNAPVDFLLQDTLGESLQFEFRKLGEELIRETFRIFWD